MKRKHLVQIWRNPATKQWNHRFTHANSKELSRQSEEVRARSVAVKSARTSYGLGQLTLVEDRSAPGVVVEIYASSLRDDVVVRIEEYS